MNIKAIILSLDNTQNHTRIDSMYKILGKPMIEYVFDTLHSLNITDITILYNSDKKLEEIQTCCKSPIRFVRLRCKEDLARMYEDSTFFDEQISLLVMPDHMPLIKYQTLLNIIDTHTKHGNAVTILANEPDHETLFTDDKKALQGLANATDYTETVIKTNVCCFNSNKLKQGIGSEELYAFLSMSDMERAKAIFQLVSTITNMGGPSDIVNKYDPYEFLKAESSLNYSMVVECLQHEINLRHMKNGVIIYSPKNTFIGPDVIIGTGTSVSPGNIIEGKTVIGAGCEIGANNKINNTIIGDYTHIQFSVMSDVRIGSHTAVGPYAYIRPGSDIGCHVKIGDFVEIKNSIIGDNTKISHLTYIGDSDVGKDINFGCGTVTVNYDGKNKFRTTIEDGAFIGCNTNLVAPVTVKKGAYIAAGSTITDDIPENALAIARSRQTNKENWKRPYA